MSEVKNKTTKTTKTTTTKRKPSTRKTKQESIIDVVETTEVTEPTTEQINEVPVENTKETREDATKRLFSELQELVKPLYNWLATNFDANTSIEVRREVVRILHDSMILNVVNEQPKQEEQK